MSLSFRINYQFIDELYKKDLLSLDSLIQIMITNDNFQYL